MEADVYLNKISDVLENGKKAVNKKQNSSDALIDWRSENGSHVEALNMRPCTHAPVYICLLVTWHFLYFLRESKYHVTERFGGLAGMDILRPPV